MTDPATLLALAERCEQAAGPDRELDVEIAFACGIVTHRRGDCFYGKNRYCSVMVLEYDYDDTEYRAPELPSYTISLDAAIALVPVEMPRNLRPGKWWWMLETWPDECRASVHYENGDSAILEESAKSATSALALCAAALRARAAMG